MEPDGLLECRSQLVLNVLGKGRGSKGKGAIDQPLSDEHTVVRMRSLAVKSQVAGRCRVKSEMSGTLSLHFILLTPPRPLY